MIIILNFIKVYTSFELWSFICFFFIYTNYVKKEKLNNFAIIITFCLAILCNINDRIENNYHRNHYNKNYHNQNSLINKNKTKYDMIVYVGRSQPFHQGHYEMFKETQKYGKHLIIVISQANALNDDKRNPFNGNDREKMIEETLSYDSLISTYSIIKLDSLNKLDFKNDKELIEKWDDNLVKNIYNEYEKIYHKKPIKDNIGYIYYNRDNINYKERLEKYFTIIEIEKSFENNISATKIREQFFDKHIVNKELPFGTKEFLKKYNKNYKNNDKIQMAITFDDLPFAGTMNKNNSTKYNSIEKILNIAKKYNIPEMYGFVNGNKVKTKEDEEILKLWTKYYPIGNHTYSHLSLNDTNVNEYMNDIIKNEDILKKFSNNKDYKYYRYPYFYDGNTMEKRNIIIKFLKQNNYKIAEVTVDFEDWAFSSAFVKCSNKNNNKVLSNIKSLYLKNAEKMLKRSIKLSNGLFGRNIKHILLLHASDLNAEYFEDLIKLYLENNVEFIALSEAMKDNIYSINYNKPFKEGREFIYQIAIANNFNLKSINVDEKDYYNSEDLKKINKICDS